jgi:hypothetical protein
MVSQVPGARIISENFGICLLHGSYNQGRIFMPEYRKMIRSWIRLLMKQEKKVRLY